MAKGKLKIDAKRIVSAIITILMGGSMIGAYFIPVVYQEISTSAGSVNASTGFSCANIITNGSDDGTYTAIAILGLISMILGCLLILGAIISVFTTVKNLDLVMICVAVLISILAIVMMIKTFTVLSDSDILVGTLSTKIGFGVFAFLIAGVIAVLSTIMQKTK